MNARPALRPSRFAGLRAGPTGARRASQRGAALLFALITLVSLMVAAIALVRSVDTGTLVLGNIGLQQDATANADQGTRAALTALAALTDRTADGSAGPGYYASAREGLDATGQQSTAATRTLIDWDGDGCAYASSGSFAACNLTPATVSGLSLPSGTSVRYVILRQCQNSGAVASANCAAPLQSAGDGGVDRSHTTYVSPTRPGSEAAVYYRVLVRVAQPRGTTSFTETIVQF